MATAGQGHHFATSRRALSNAPSPCSSHARFRGDRTIATPWRAGISAFGQSPGSCVSRSRFRTSATTHPFADVPNSTVRLSRPRVRGFGVPARLRAARGCTTPGVPCRPFSCFRQFSATRTRERQDTIQHYAYARLQRATRTFKSGSAVLALTVSLRSPESLPLDSARSQPLTRDLMRFSARGDSRLTPRAIPARDAHVQVRERGFCAYSQSPGPTSHSHDSTTSRPLRHFNTRPTTPRLRVRAVPATHDVPAPRTCAPSRSQPSSRDFGALLRVLRREACPGS